jgi:hypothetical protein
MRPRNKLRPLRTCDTPKPDSGVRLLRISRGPSARRRQPVGRTIALVVPPVRGGRVRWRSAGTGADDRTHVAQPGQALDTAVQLGPVTRTAGCLRDAGRPSCGAV